MLLRRRKSRIYYLRRFFDILSRSAIRAKRARDLADCGQGSCFPSAAFRHAEWGRRPQYVIAGIPDRST